MANFSELSGIKQWGAVLLGGAIVTGALYFTVFKTQNTKNASAQHDLESKIQENNELESYRPKLKQIEQQLAELKQQLEIEQRIVPDDKQVDDFMTIMSAEAQKAGVEIRRYTAKPTNQKEYYTEMPFDLELERIAGFDDQESRRSQSEAYIPVRAQRERGGDLHRDYILQSRFASERSGQRA
jgi:Tfp pilus assembly protein PilO